MCLISLILEIISSLKVHLKPCGRGFCLRWPIDKTSVEGERLSDFAYKWKSEGDRWRASLLLWGLTGVTFQLHPVPQPASVRTRKLSSCAQRRHTHTCAHCGTQSPGIWVGEKIPWKIPESWAFKSLDGSLCFKAKGAAFMLLVAPGWTASIPQLVNKGESLKPSFLEKWIHEMPYKWLSEQLSQCVTAKVKIFSMKNIKLLLTTSIGCSDNYAIKIIK